MKLGRARICAFVVQPTRPNRQARHVVPSFTWLAGGDATSSRYLSRQVVTRRQRTRSLLLEPSEPPLRNEPRGSEPDKFVSIILVNSSICLNSMRDSAAGYTPMSSRQRRTANTFPSSPFRSGTSTDQSNCDRYLRRIEGKSYSKFHLITCGWMTLMRSHPPGPSRDNHFFHLSYSLRLALSLIPLQKWRTLSRASVWQPSRIHSRTPGGISARAVLAANEVVLYLITLPASRRWPERPQRFPDNPDPLDLVRPDWSSIQRHGANDTLYLP